MKRCRWVTEKDGFRWHYPGCWGSVIYGPRGCNCPPKGDRDLQAEIDVMMAKIVKLEKKLCGGIKNSTRTKKNGQS